MTITAASFPTPALALRSTDRNERYRVRGFAVEQAAAAETMRVRLDEQWRGRRSRTARRAALAAVHADLIRWRYELALRAPGRLGQGIPFDPSRFLLTLRDGGANFDRVGYVGRLREGATWDPRTRTFRGGRSTPAHRIMVAYGRMVLDRFAGEGNDGDELHNRVRLPDGRRLSGNRLVRGAAARRVAADLVARIARRGCDADRIETGGEPIYVVTAEPEARESMFHAALDLMAGAEPGDLDAWRAARYLLYQAPVTKKGSDAVTRTFLVAVGAVLLGTPPVLDHDVDLRCIVLGQSAATALPSDNATAEYPPARPRLSLHR